ncbi:hypothetical protein VNO77_21906 [Canavalia gladiata]|uniref:Uncharacterized protein n=1 Tax=Canavalia gladiata TaxID=3824 RepID=A0AAN9Q7J6_CANGL
MMTSLSICTNSIRWPRGSGKEDDHRRPHVLELSFFEIWVWVVRLHYTKMASTVSTPSQPSFTCLVVLAEKLCFISPYSRLKLSWITSPTQLNLNQSQLHHITRGDNQLKHSKGERIILLTTSLVVALGEKMERW